MRVINKGHDNCILTVYNGKTYCFYKGIPVEISPEIYNNIIISGHISAQDVVIVDDALDIDDAPEEKPRENIARKVIEKIKPKGKKR